MARGSCGAGITRHHRIPICVARHKETRQYRSRTTVRRDSCSSGALPRKAKSFAPLRGKPPYGAPKRKQCNKRCFLQIRQKSIHFTKTKVLKRKRQKIHISKHRIPICVARHKETRQYHSRTAVRRDSCSSGALPRNAKSFASLRGKSPYTSIGYADGRSAMKKRHAVKARRL